MPRKNRVTLKTLNEKTFDWIEKTEKARKESLPGCPRTNAERQRYFQIRLVAFKELEDLMRLAECLPEKQLKHIFKNKNLQNLFRALNDFMFRNFNSVSRNFNSVSEEEVIE